jgi:hypothetical protein
MKANGRRSHFVWMLGWSLVLFTSTGASCIPWPRQSIGESSPVVFERTPTLDEVVQRVHQNTAAIRQLQADHVRLTAPGAPSLKASLSLQLPRRLRLTGDFLMSREVDIGSNDEVFWLWAKNGTGALLYARHDEYARIPLQHKLPVDPQWLIEAMGLVTFDPAARHEGPYAHGQDQMEVHTYFSAPSGESLRRITVIHSVYGWVMEQHIYDGASRLLASARATNHRYYGEVGATLPDVIDVQIAPGQPSQMVFQVDVGGYRINQGYVDPDEWTMPTMEDYPYVNLADPRAVEQMQRAGRTASRPVSETESGAYRPQYRGYSR